MIIRTILLSPALLVVAMAHAQLGPEHRFSHPMYSMAQPFIADPDGDGDGDVILTSGVSFWFYEQVSQDTYTVTAELAAGGPLGVIQVEDIDGDGFGEVLLLEQGTGTIISIPGLGGVDFGPPVDLVADVSGLRDFRLADLDADGDPDLVLHHGQVLKKVSWCSNDGSGNFSTAQNLHTWDGYSPPGRNSFVLEDLDLDGDPDILTQNEGGFTALLRNDGNGNFVVHGLPVAVSDAELLAGDMDDDGEKDLVVRTGYGSAFSIVAFLNDGGTFDDEDQVTIVAPDYVAMPFVVDADGDGDDDVFYRLGGLTYQVQSRRNEGNGDFGSTPLCPSFSTGFDLPEYAVGRLDGNDTLDIVCNYNDGLFVALNGSGPLIRLNAVFKPAYITAGDFNGDGSQDAVLSSTVDLGFHLARPLRLSLHNNEGGGLLHDQPSQGWAPAYSQSPFGASGIARMRSGDLDGDGDPDLLAVRQAASSSNGTWIIFSNNDGSLDSTGSLGAYWWCCYDSDRMHLGDLDGDGDLDAVHHMMGGIVTSENAGDATFTTTTYGPPPLSNMQSALTLCDVDDDGAVEYVWMVNDSLFYADYDGNGSPTVPVDLGPAPVSCEFISAADLDGDGIEDLVLLDDDSTTFMYNDGNNGFANAMTIPYAGYWGTEGAAYGIGDLDGNGFPDLVMMLDNGEILYWANYGSSVNGPFSLVVAGGHSGRSDLDLADMDGDGDLDVLTCSDGGAAAWLENTGDLPTAVCSIRTATSLLVFPNPMHDYTRLILPRPLGTSASIELLDASGRVVRTMKGNGTKELLIERGPLSSGLYIVRLAEAGGTGGSVRMALD